MRFVGSVIVLCSVSASLAAYASDTAISVNASVCEKLINGESRASARVRASDKASFKAVEDLSELSSYRSKLDTHNFNLKVYRLVDNHLEDVQITTTEQSQDKICVRLTAYLPKEAVATVFEAPADTAPEIIADITDAEEMTLDIEDDIDENIAIAIPPKPDIVINKEISYEAVAEPQIVSVETQPQPVVLSQPVMPMADNKKIVFIDKTEFYNGSDTAGFFSSLEQIVLHTPGLKAAALPNNPDYILKTKVLKAKVDNVNSETSRLQIVAALELIDTKTSEKMTDHQNRFILFNASDDAQKVASALTRKLLSVGAEKLLAKIKPSPEDKNSSSVITPH